MFFYHDQISFCGDNVRSDHRYSWNVRGTRTISCPKRAKENKESSEAGSITWTLETLFNWQGCPEYIYEGKAFIYEETVSELVRKKVVTIQTFDGWRGRSTTVTTRVQERRIKGVTWRHGPPEIERTVRLFRERFFWWDRDRGVGKEVRKMFKTKRQATEISIGIRISLHGLFDVRASKGYRQHPNHHRPLYKVCCCHSY